MSYFGRNIKKIRAAKNISQTAFADLFELTRANIGSYEEGRAEAKIDTIIAIADYFQLTLDQLLKTELTINDIYHIGEINKKLELTKKDLLSDLEIPFVSLTDLPEFIRKFDNRTFLYGLQKIKLPGALKNSIALEISDLMIVDKNLGIKEKDILVAQKISIHEIEQNTKDTFYIILTDDLLQISKIESDPNGVFNFQKQSESAKVAWRVYQILSRKIPIPDQIEKRLQNIENQINLLAKKILNQKV